jgi:hypothetical protein
MEDVRPVEPAQPLARSSETWLTQFSERVGQEPDPRWCAGLARAMRHDVHLRDEVLSRAATAGDVGALFEARPDPLLVERHRATLAACARHAQPEDRAAPLAVLAWAAWWSGNGVRARGLVTRALEADPDYSLTRLVENLIDALVPPPWTSR